MTPTPRGFWPALNRVIGLSAVLAEWRLEAGDDFGRLRRYLRATPRVAASYPKLGAEPESPLPYRVVCHGDEDVVGICPDGTGSIRLARGDLIVYELDRVALSRQLAAALGLVFDCVEPRQPPGAWRVGLHCALTDEKVWVYAAIAGGPQERESALASLATLQTAAFAVLTPTRAYWRAWPEALRRRGRVVALDSLIAVADDGGFTCTAIPATVLATAERTRPGKKAARKPIGLFPTPPGTRWSDVKIRFVDGHTVSVEVGPVRQLFNYTQLGMGDGRSAKPDVQWALLRQFAENRGQLTWMNSDAGPKNQNRKELLAAALKAFLRLDAEPFENIPGGWKALFCLEPDA